MHEEKFIAKNIKKMLLFKQGKNLLTKKNMNENIYKIGECIGKIGFGGQKLGGYSKEEVGELLEILSKGFIAGATGGSN